MSKPSVDETCACTARSHYCRGPGEKLRVYIYIYIYMQAGRQGLKAEHVMGAHGLTVIDEF